MKYLFLSLLMGCNTYSGVIISKGYSYRSIEAKISEYHYIMPTMTIDDYDSLKIGDTILIDKATLRMIK